MIDTTGRTLTGLLAWLAIFAFAGLSTGQRRTANPLPGPHPRHLMRLHVPSDVGPFSLFRLRFNRSTPISGDPGTEPTSEQFRAGFATNPKRMNAFTHGSFGSAGAVSDMPDSSVANPQSADNGQNVAAVLSANGLPHRDGVLRWPVGLLGLSGSEATGSRLDVDGALSQAAAGEQRDAFGATVKGKAVPAIRQLQRALEDQKRELAAQDYEEAAQFLRKLNKAVHDLE
jgi:hypothetical protein